MKTLGRLSSLGITATLLVSLLQFGWAQVKTSSQSALGLSILTQLGDDGQSADRLFHEFSAHVTLKNPTDSEVRILWNTYAVFGTALTPQPGSDEDFARRLQQSRLAGGFESRYLTYVPRKLLEAGEFLTNLFPLQPGQEFVADFELAIPQEELSKYRILRFETNFVLAKGDSLRVDTGRRWSIGACSYGTLSGDLCNVREWRVVAPGWLWTLTKGTQIVEVVEGIKFKAGEDQGDAAWLAACITRDVGQLDTPATSVCDASRRKPTLETFFAFGYLSPVVSEQPIVAPRQGT